MADNNNPCKCKSCTRSFSMDEYRYTEDETKCILHCTKENWYTTVNGKKDWTKSEKKIKFFWELIHKIIDNENKREDITSISNEYLKDKLVDIYGYVYKKIIFPRINYGNLDNQLLDFNDITNINIKFENCIFLDEINFSCITKAKKVSFISCEFYNDIKFNNQIITEEFRFIKSNVYGKCHFSHVIFNENVNFNKSKFNEISFQKSVFQKGCIFSNVHFIDILNFKYTQFYDKVIFRDAIITSKLDLRKTIFYKDANFLDITLKERKMNSDYEYIGQPTDIKVANRETARIIKNFYDNTNNIIEGNRFYKLEMIEKEKELKFLQKPFEWLVFKFHRLSSNHSQNWLLPLFWIFLISYLVVSIKTTYGMFETILYNFFNYDVLDKMANIINPFSIMTKGEPLTFTMLIFKSIIVYLLYQFVVSIRQNTRRK